jgi:hypothetical protein
MSCKIRLLNKELGRTPADQAGGEEEEEEDDSSSDESGGPDEDMQRSASELEGLRAACSSRRPRWEDELRDDYASVTSGGSTAKGKRGTAKGERSRSPLGKAGGLEPSF